MIKKLNLIMPTALLPTHYHSLMCDLQNPTPSYSPPTPLLRLLQKRMLQALCRGPPLQRVSPQTPL